MNGALGGDLGLQTYHHHQQQQQQPASLHPAHQGFSQPDPAHYRDTSSSALSLSSLQSMAPTAASVPAGPTASLGQYVISASPQQQQQQQQGHLDLSFGGSISNHSIHSGVQPISSSGHNVSPSLQPPAPSSSSPHPAPSLPPSLPPTLPQQPSASSSPTPPPVVSSGSGSGSSEGGVPSSSASLFGQMSQLGPSERCTPSQAQAMGQQLLNIIAQSKRNKAPLPSELQNSFDVFHRCLAVVYGTFFLNLYTKANAPCLLCHGCKSLYPPGQFIHHTCPNVPPNILPCRSRMWRRCLAPLVSPGMDKLQQKQRWKYVLEKFSHTAAALAGRRNPIPPEIEAQLLEMPELKRGRFVESPSKQKPSPPTPQGNTGGEGESDEGKVGGSVVKSEDPLEERLREERGVVGTSITVGTRFHGLVNIEGEGLKEGSTSPPEGTQNLLDIEPPDYELDEGTSPPAGGPGDTQRATSAQSSEGEGSTVASGSNALALAEQLTAEVRRLNQELSVQRAKLNTATEIIEKMPSEACMREQLAQAIATQQSLQVERDQAREQLKLSQERETRMQKQLDGLRTAFSNMEKLFTV